MPTYIYNCPKCGQETEAIHGMNENPQVVCQQCGASCVRKSIYTFSFTGFPKVPPNHLPKELGGYW